MENNIQKAYFAGGCFWGVEYYFEKLEGVVSTRVGYMGGHTNSPSYEAVSGKKTGHAESLEVTFNSSKVTYEELAKLFFEIHDSTQINKQGPDVGEQYRSIIFYVNEEQKQTAKNLISILKEKGYNVATQLTRLDKFWEAEDYHQKYYTKGGGTPYCHVRKKIF